RRSPSTGRARAASRSCRNRSVRGGTVVCHPGHRIPAEKRVFRFDVFRCVECAPHRSRRFARVSRLPRPLRLLRQPCPSTTAAASSCEASRASCERSSVLPPVRALGGRGGDRTNRPVVSTAYPLLIAFV